MKPDFIAFGRVRNDLGVFHPEVSNLLTVQRQQTTQICRKVEPRCPSETHPASVDSAHPCRPPVEEATEACGCIGLIRWHKQFSACISAGIDSCYPLDILPSVNGGDSRA